LKPAIFPYIRTVMENEPILPYLFVKSKNDTQFNFISVGKAGEIEKTIKFSKTKYDFLYNLSLTDTIAGSARNGNGDSDKIIETVISSIISFTLNRPEIWISIIGNTAVLARFFKISICKRIEDFKDQFDVYEDMELHWEEFNVCVKCKGFVVRRKNDNYLVPL
jgi:hypothetical protein